MTHPHQIPVADPDEIEQPIETEMRQRMIGALPHQRLGPEGDTHPRQIEHGQVVRPVAHGDHLLERDTFLRRDVSGAARPFALRR